MWQNNLGKNITTIEELNNKLKLSPQLQKSLEDITTRFPMSVTPYYLSLIDWSDENDPIRRMCIPSLDELDMTGRFDTSGEMMNTKTEGLQHKYSSTALILSTNVCAMYCRHCFRKRAVGISTAEILKNFEYAADYVKNHTEISNVLISGGDSFLMDNKIIERYLNVYSDIEHLDFIRFGTRTPVTFPERITNDEELLDILETYNSKKQLYIITHFNHPNEITSQSADAVQKLIKRGLIVRNQTVLLRGVNDDGEVLGRLLKQLTAIGAVPYYIFQCRPVSGAGAHFQVPLIDGYRIVEQAKTLQNGIGKSLRYIMSHETGKLEIIGLAESNAMIFKYHQAKEQKDRGRIFQKMLSPTQAWLN